MEKLTTLEVGWVKACLLKARMEMEDREGSDDPRIQEMINQLQVILDKLTTR